MRDNFRKSSIVPQIRRLFIEYGLDEAQADLIIDKLRAESAENLNVQNKDQSRLDLANRLVWFITTRDVGHNAPHETFKVRYDHYYGIMIGVLSATIYDDLVWSIKFIEKEIVTGVQFIRNEIGASSDTEAFLGRGSAPIPKDGSGRSIEDLAAQAQFTQQGPKLVGTVFIGNALQGSSVSLSSDGNTAIIGGLLTNAAWVYARSGGVWSQQARLVGTGAIGNAFQGRSVALSGDGNTAIVGGPVDNRVRPGGADGAAWVFTRSGGVWSQQAKLVGTDAIGKAEQGISVSLSGDGNTAIVGGTGDNNLLGAAWVYVRSGGVWTQQGPKLIGTGALGTIPAQQGLSVSLSGDGNTAIVGGAHDNREAGPAWVYTRSAGVWNQQAKLVATNTIGPFGQAQGISVSLSGDGNTAIVGGSLDNDMIGAAWVFTRSGGIWTQQTKLVGTDAIGPAGQGDSVSLSANGNTAILGGPGDNKYVGAAWVFTRSGGSWSQQTKLVGTGAMSPANQGSSVSLSNDGNTVIVGGPNDNNQVGAAWVYVWPIFAATPG